ARWQPVDARYLSTQRGVCVVVACNPERAILLKLFDQRIRDQNFDARYKRTIPKRRHRNGVNVAQIVRLYRTDVIARATGDREAKDFRERGFQGDGKADTSGEDDAPGDPEG